MLATSNDSIVILFPLEAMPEMKPLRAFRFDMLLPRVSKTSTAFSRLTAPAFPINELFWQSCRKEKHNIDKQKPEPGNRKANPSILKNVEGVFHYHKEDSTSLV